MGNGSVCTVNGGSVSFDGTGVSAWVDGGSCARRGDREEGDRVEEGEGGMGALSRETSVWEWDSGEWTWGREWGVSGLVVGGGVVVIDSVGEREMGGDGVGGRVSNTADERWGESTLDSVEGRVPSMIRTWGLLGGGTALEVCGVVVDTGGVVSLGESGDVRVGTCWRSCGWATSLVKGVGVGGGLAKLSRLNGRALDFGCYTDESARCDRKVKQDVRDHTQRQHKSPLVWVF